MEWSDSSAATLLEEVHDQFEYVFKSHFKGLNAYAYTFLRDVSLAEEAVQEVFYKLWEKKEQIGIHSSLKAYLYRSVHNECLNFLKHQKVKSDHQRYTMHQEKEYSENSDPAVRLAGIELEQKIQHALNELPEQCRTIFQLSRFESLKYQEIAGQLGISVKTVENQMLKALKRLRISLAEYLPLFVAILNMLTYLT